MGRSWSISDSLDESRITLGIDPDERGRAAGRAASRIGKAFNTTHPPALAEGQVEGVALDVLLAGDDDAAKSQVSDLVEAVGLRPIGAGRLDSARRLERLTPFPIELSQRDGRDFRLTFKLLPAALRG
jgi:predicted dinucleotide-binding enzyme